VFLVHYGRILDRRCLHHVSRGCIDAFFDLVLSSWFSLKLRIHSTCERLVPDTIVSLLSSFLTLPADLGRNAVRTD